MLINLEQRIVLNTPAWLRPKFYSSSIYPLPWLLEGFVPRATPFISFEMEYEFYAEAFIFSPDSPLIWLQNHPYCFGRIPDVLSTTPSFLTSNCPILYLLFAPIHSTWQKNSLPGRRTFCDTFSPGLLNSLVPDTPPLLAPVHLCDD